MQFTKAMIELVYEIRRFAPSDMKPAIKLANPELFSELRTYYHDDANTVCRALIKELFFQAGDPWASRLMDPNNQTTEQTLRVYRGQLQIEDRPIKVSENELASEAEIKKPSSKRIYRGQLVES
jgi:hypothetical protein